MKATRKRVGQSGLSPWASQRFWRGNVAVGAGHMGHDRRSSPLYLLASEGALVRYGAILIVCVLGAIAAHRVGEAMNEHDSNHIVIDEVAGVAIATLPFGSLTLTSWVVAVIAFRVFDIRKPWPIRSIDDNWNSGFGVMADDMLAGLYALPIVTLSQWLTA